MVTNDAVGSLKLAHTLPFADKTGLAAEKKSLYAAERDRAVNQQKREAGREQVTELDPAHFVFVEESGVTRSMTRRYGRAPRGERVYGAVPLGHGEVTTLIGAWALEGVRASFTVEAAAEADVFRVFGEQALVPAWHPGDVVIGDNLPAPKAPELNMIRESAQATRWPLPPSSPDFHPLEQCWSKGVPTRGRGPHDGSLGPSHCSSLCRCYGHRCARMVSTLWVQGHLKCKPL